MWDQNHSQFAKRRPVAGGRSQSNSLNSRLASRRLVSTSSDGYGAPIFAKKFDVPVNARVSQSSQPATTFPAKSRVQAPDMVKRKVNYAPQTRVYATKQKQTNPSPQARMAILQKTDDYKKPSWFAWLTHMSRPQLAMVSAAVIIFILGLSVSLLGLKTNAHVEAQTKEFSKATKTSENNGDNPDESEPSSGTVGDYKTEPNLPKSITISKIGIKARVKPIGTKSTNELKAPANIYDTGWYLGSAKPGENGAMLIDGHVHGPTKPGVFYNLKKLSEGDIIQIERGDGQIFKYMVVKKQVYNRSDTDMVAAITSVQPGRPGLNLMTCTGSLEKGNLTYDQRLLVQAVQVD